MDKLFTWEVGGKKVRPKVIASTATIRKAADQVHALFLRTVRIFPPWASALTKEVKQQEAKARNAEVEELLAYGDPPCQAIIRGCAAESLPLPVVGYELMDGQGRVCADAELAWPSHQAALLLPEQMDAAAALGQARWKVLPVDPANAESLQTACGQRAAVRDTDGRAVELYEK